MKIADHFGLGSPSAIARRVFGEGRQQVRLAWTEVGAFHVCLWTLTATGTWTWGRQAEGLSEPGNSESRRPCQADEGQAWRHAAISAIRPPPVSHRAQFRSKNGLWTARTCGERAGWLQTAGLLDLVEPARLVHRGAQCMQAIVGMMVESYDRHMN